MKRWDRICVLESCCFQLTVLKYFRLKSLPKFCTSFVQVLDQNKHSSMCLVKSQETSPSRIWDRICVIELSCFQLPVLKYFRLKTFPSFAPWIRMNTAPCVKGEKEDQPTKRLGQNLCHRTTLPSASCAQMF